MADINTVIASMNMNLTAVNKTSINYSKVTNNMLIVNNQLGKSLDSAKSSASKAGDKVKALIGKFKELKNVTKAFDLADSLSVSNTKLDKVYDGSQPSKDKFHEKVAAAAGSSRSTYKDMSGYVAKLSTSGDTFKKNDDAVAFAELMQKAVVAGGTDDRGAAMNQMIDRLSKGSLGSEDLQAASGTTPLVMESLKSYTGKSSEDLYKMADQGEITADVIKNAMFSMSGDINGAFANTKMTFGETWDKLKEGALQAASGVLEKINEIIANPQVQQFIDKIIAGMSLLGDVATSVCDFIISNWNIIGFILGFIGGVALVSMITSLWGMLPPLLAQAAAWLAINWPILLIVGLLVAVTGILVNMGVSFEQVCTAIGGYIGELGANIYNFFIDTWNGTAELVNFLGNSFNIAIANIKILFLDLAITALSNITKIGKGFSSFISKLTGKKINIAAGITEMTDALSSEKTKAMGDMGNKVYMDYKAPMDVQKAALNGEKAGSNFAGKAKNAVNSVNDTLNKYMTKDPVTSPGYTPFQGGAAGSSTSPFQGSKNILGDQTKPLKVEGTGAGGSMNVEMPDEDKEYLKNIAERDYIANVATNSLAPNISVQFGDVHKTADANKVAGRIKKILREQIAMASEGVY
ncbi:tape measure protein [Anaerocolumna xylanovorans]|uniref:Tape measure domain-containing protein n=1 Tax=Anaerocolumna xylanovorans DSM 12503 TaxID=1121345 RepID=A0A1M7Y6A8_9FIRM|nr:tape measure protein [Anaerocolumna xylanovorans]SHO48140.1 tape measure domain-containing protein [Anaerocolumna xylanovorans DSM 12503]